jgi:hypothetical protein
MEYHHGLCGGGEGGDYSLLKSSQSILLQVLNIQWISDKEVPPITGWTKENLSIHVMTFNQFKISLNL